jgi:hypothetical protein
MGAVCQQAHCLCVEGEVWGMEVSEAKEQQIPEFESAPVPWS